MTNSFYKKRLSTDKVIKYLSELYPNKIITFKEQYNIQNIVSHLQAHYGLEGDCTLTSILTCVKFWDPVDRDTDLVYNQIEGIANKYFYNGNTYGTIPIFIKTIFSKVLKFFGINKTVKQAYFKNIGFNFKTIKKQIDNNTPVILSLYNDGRDYYESHTVTIVGYIVYIVDGKEIPLLEVLDNWYYYGSIIDYSAMSIISEITY